MTHQSPESHDSARPSRRRFLQLSAAGIGSSLLPAFGARGLLADDAAEASTDFLAAVRAGDLETVRRLLEARPALLGAADDRGRTAFALAYLEGHREVGEHLASRGYLADAHEAALALDWQRFEEATAGDVSVVNRRDHPIGGSAMYAAALGGAGADLWRVYAMTGDPNLAAPGGSPLQAALRYPDLPTAELSAATLLANAASPNLPASPDPPASKEPPPLHLAAARGSVEIVEMLIRLGADVGALDGRRRTALEIAHSSGHPAVAALLADHARVPRSRPTSRTAYDLDGKPYTPPDVTDIPLVERRTFVGKSHGDLEYVQEALDREPRLVHSAATTSEISVEACAHTGRTPIVDLLLNHGAPYSLPTAVMRGDRRRVVELLDQEPGRITERGAHDFALLWYPIIGNCEPEMMELLLARGAQVEQQHFLGTTALHWACLRGRVELVELLIDHGADVNRSGRKFRAEGETPLDCARRREQEAVARLLIDRSARG